ncbi:MAG: cyclic nucleotide-binding [Beijerinckiaceae bacterium]|nr:MAG: cyclic nucleotide-binding [Beijerinckiaceae bacterium]
MRLDDVIEILKSIPLFKPVDPEALRLLAFSSVRRQLRPGDILFRRGEVSDGGFLVISGEIVLDPADDGSPSTHVFGPGTLIGQLALFAPVERSATAIARDAAVVLVFSRDLMLKVLDAHPESAAVLRTTLAGQVRAFAGQVSRAAG